MSRTNQSDQIIATTYKGITERLNKEIIRHRSIQLVINQMPVLNQKLLLILLVNFFLSTSRIYRTPVAPSLQIKNKAYNVMIRNIATQTKRVALSTEFKIRI